jgi:hypothetical protein
MAQANVPSDLPSDNPPILSDTVLASLSRSTELRLRVAPDRQLGCVTIGVDGLGAGVSCLISTGNAIVLVERLIAVGELRAVEQQPYDLGPPDLGAGPLSSTF